MKTVEAYIKILILLILLAGEINAQTTVSPDLITFERQGVQRLIFNEDQNIPLSSLTPSEIIGITAMHPITYYSESQADIQIKNKQLSIQSLGESQASIWFGGFNPFAVYTIDLDSFNGQGEIGFEFSDMTKTEQFFIIISCKDNSILDVIQKYVKESEEVSNESVFINSDGPISRKGKIILQMLGSGFTLFLQNDDLPVPIAQSNFAQIVDLREKKYIRSLQSNLFFSIKDGAFAINKISSALNPGMGLADIRAITYEDGEPLPFRKRKSNYWQLKVK